MGIFGYFGYCIESIVLYRHCINTYRAALGGGNLLFVISRRTRLLPSWACFFDPYSLFIVQMQFFFIANLLVTLWLSFNLELFIPRLIWKQLSIALFVAPINSII